MQKFNLNDVLYTMQDLNYNFSQACDAEVWYDGALYKIVKVEDPDTVKLKTKTEGTDIGSVKSEVCDVKNILDFFSVKKFN